MTQKENALIFEAKGETSMGEVTVAGKDDTNKLKYKGETIRVTIEKIDEE